MDLINLIKKNWGFDQVDLLHKYHVSGDRIVCKVGTEEGSFILKGIPTDIKESVIIGNTKAHEYLGNQKGLAPKLIYMPDGCAYLKEEIYYFYLIDFLEGRQMQETIEDEYLLGRAAAKLHELNDYEINCSFDSEEQKKIYHEWFSERSFKAEYDTIIDALPDFNKEKQCFIHTDIGPHNAILDLEGTVKFVDLDDSGIGSKYIDLGWPFIMQFVKFNKETHEMHYRIDLAEAFIRGYYGDKIVTKEELDLIWSGAIYMHIAYMQCFGPDAVESLWKILKFGIEQKDKLFQKMNEIRE